MADEGPDLGYCEECEQFGEVIYINDVTYCLHHMPLILSGEDFEMIFEKAGVDHPPATLLKQLRAIFKGKL